MTKFKNIYKVTLMNFSNVWDYRYGLAESTADAIAAQVEAELPSTIRVGSVELIGVVSFGLDNEP